MNYEFKSKREYDLVHVAVKDKLYKLQDAIPWFRHDAHPEEVEQWEKDVETMKLFLKDSGLIYHNTYENDTKTANG